MRLVNDIYEYLEKGIEEYSRKLLSVPSYVLSEAKHLIEQNWNMDFRESLKAAKEG
jgi:hypothetical protein